MTLKEAQELIDTWAGKNNIRNNELTNMALLTEEIGKLARVMVRRYNDPVNEPHVRYEVSEEIGNILWALINVANQTGVDLTVALVNALENRSNEHSMSALPKK